jgi:hypothetical protein
MTEYERRVIPVGDDGCFTLEGRLIAVLDSPRTGENQITALVELPSEEGAGSAPIEDDPEGVNETAQEWMDRDVEENKEMYQALADGQPTCAGKKADDSPCAREVDAPGERCWQHPEDE